jgi:hypothetical protein
MPVAGAMVNTLTFRLGVAELPPLIANKRLFAASITMPRRCLTPIELQTHYILQRVGKIVHDAASSVSAARRARSLQIQPLKLEF